MMKMNELQSQAIIWMNFKIAMLNKKLGTKYKYIIFYSTYIKF